jgi:hypothetical protein
MVRQDQESPKIEIEIATLILGVLLVLISILTTMPSEVSDLLKKMVYYAPSEYGPIMTPAVNVISTLVLGSLLLLIVTIPFYLLYLSLRKTFVLIVARTGLILSMALTIPLLVMFAGLFMFRIMSKQGAEALINPTFSIVTVSGALIAMIWIFALWHRSRANWLPILKRHFSERSKGQDNSSRSEE